MASVLGTLSKIKQAVWARISLRRCNKVGALSRVSGKVIVENGGTMIIGRKCRFRGTHVPIELATMQGGSLTIGDNCSFNSGISICSQVEVSIGNNCGIGNYVLIFDTDFHDAVDHTKGGKAAPICIGDNVWLAARVTVLKGVVIGEGAVVSAGSVVVTNVPPYTLVGGVPARVIKKLPQPGDPVGVESDR